MAARLIKRDPRYVLNFCAKHLARDRGDISEPWRFPIVDRHRDSFPGPPREDSPVPPGDSPPAPAGGLPTAMQVGTGRSWSEDAVTFVWDGRDGVADSVELVGSMLPGRDPVPLREVLFDGHATGYSSVSLAVPRGTIHQYLFLVDGVLRPDPINPQRTRSDNGTVWSRFFTTGCVQAVVLERWEFSLLERLCDHILPFRTEAGERFLSQFYHSLDRASRTHSSPLAYKIDQSVGIANYIDCVLAREEAHRLVDYRICLTQIARILGSQHSSRSLSEIAREPFVELYEQLARNEVPGWNYEDYAEPRHFLKLLRRHAVTGAFSHPDYGGNSGGAGWAFLGERYHSNGTSLFDFGNALEPELGRSTVYLG
jgi:hypothetical protein